MTISSISPSIYNSLLNSQQTTNSAAAPSNVLGDIGSQLLANIAQSQGTGSTLSDPLIQELVSLGSQSSGQTATPQTYNAQGLLQQVQSSMMLNDPLLQQLGATDTTNSTNSDSLLQSLLSMSQPPASPAVVNGATSSVNSGTATTAQTDVNANWSQILQQDPAMASVLVQSQMEQSMLSMLG